MDELKKLYIEPTSKCNLSCSMCFRNTWIGERFTDMDIDIFERVINTRPESVETLFIGGMGEPLFHKDILRMVSLAAEKGLKVELLTNGTMLSREMAAALLSAGLGRVWVSVDSFKAPEYESIRKNGSFDLVKKNLSGYNIERFLAQERSPEGRRASLGIAFVAMKSNIDQLRDIARFAIEYSVDEINVSNLIPTDRESQEQSLCSRVVGLDIGVIDSQGGYPRVSLPYLDAGVKDVRDGVMSLFEQNCIISINGEPVVRKRRFCRFIEQGMCFVRSDGDVSPCMALLHSAKTFLDGNERTVFHHSFGNMRGGSLSDIWNSPPYADFRRRVRGFEFSPCLQCGGCENRESNEFDCVGNNMPTCGACLWSEGVISCP